MAREPLLCIRDLRGGPPGAEIVKGVSLDIAAGEVAAIMGPNGSGKSTFVHLLMGRPGFMTTGGEVLLDGSNIADLPTYERSRRGMFAAFQYPTELPGVRLEDVMKAALRARERDFDLTRLDSAVHAVGLDSELLERGLNDEFSGGEKKRAEIAQLEVLEPKAAILDEIDSGLDVDGLRAIAATIREMAVRGLAVLLITHYKLLLDYVEPASVYIFSEGTISRSGGAEIAAELEIAGYSGGSQKT